MEALLPVFIAVLLAETGGTVQAGTYDLYRRFGSATTVLVALGATTFAGVLVAAIGASIIARMIGFEARSLMAGLSLLFAGVPMFLPGRAKQGLSGKGALSTSLRTFVPLQFGGAAQFIVFAFAARSGQAPLAATAGLLATLTAGALPIMAGKSWPSAIPLGRMRRVAAALLLGAGGWMIVDALRLI